MPFTGWTKQSLSWYMDASDYTGFHRRLAETILPFVGSADTLIDLGCGPGCIDLELASHVGSITAIDIDSLALGALDAEAARRGVENIRTLHADAEHADISGDVILMSLYAPEDMDSLFSRAKRCVVRIMNGSSISKLTPGEAPKDIPSHVLFARHLEQLGLRYELIQTDLEFGQPLTDRQQAADFVRHYDGASTVTEALAFLDNNLIHTGDEPFPYYMPYSKPVCIFHIPT